MVFIVIEGTDGSGKTTQFKRLVERLRGAGKRVEIFDFPRYGQRSAALVEDYLNGKFGTAEEVGPYRASIFYACDRYAASPEIKKALAEGAIVISNRYVSSNMGHQAGKIRDPEERDRFLEWLDNLEFRIFGIPRPDMTLLLYMPPEIGQKLVDQKAARSYIEGGKKKDIHEADLNHLKKAAEAYSHVSNLFSWTIIDCAPKGKLRTIEDVADEIWGKVEPLIGKKL